MTRTSRPMSAASVLMIDDAPRAGERAVGKDVAVNKTPPALWPGRLFGRVSSWLSSNAPVRIFDLRKRKIRRA